MLTFNFTFRASDAVPQSWCYWKRSPAVNYPPAMGHPVKETQCVMNDLCADVRVVFTELDNGAEVEWRVELCPSHLTKAKHHSLVSHGHMQLAQFSEAQSHVTVAAHLAQMAMNQAFPFARETLH